MRELAVGGSILTKKYYSFENPSCIHFILLQFFNEKRFLPCFHERHTCTNLFFLSKVIRNTPFEIYDPKYGYLMTKLGVPSNRRTTNSPKRHLKISSSILFLFLNISDNIYVLII